MSDLIKREDAIIAINELSKEPSFYHTDNDYWICGVIEARDVVENVPSVDRPQGEWIIEIDANGNTYGRCSICGMRQYAGQLNFCPDCGAKMKGANDEVLRQL